jgi:hypothetical protein
MLVGSIEAINSIFVEFSAFEREIDIEFECNTCHKLEKMKLRSAKTKKELLCHVCQTNKGKSKRTEEQNIETDIKRKRTCLDRYGVDNPTKSQKILDKRRKKCLETGAIHNRNTPFNNPIVQEKCKKTKNLHNLDET